MNWTFKGSLSNGFALSELLTVLAIFGFLMAMLFSSLGESQKSSGTAREEAEMNQTLQDAMALMTSELRFIGFPPASYYDLSYLQSASSPKNLVAQGLVDVGPNFIKFQGDINADQVVDYVHYYLSGATAPYSLNRFAGSVNPDGTPPGGSAQKLSEQVERLEFRYFDRFGAQTTSVTEIVSIEVRLTLRTRYLDPATRIYRTADESTRIHPLNL
jgi:prepilin-type N-terminal cleavage/methylation domain-containing protein